MTYEIVKDIPQAIYWYRKAAAQGHSLAEEAIRRFDYGY